MCDQLKRRFLRFAIPFRKHRQHLLFVGLFFFASTVFTARAIATPSKICEQAAAIVSQETGVPFDVLKAITLTETGRTLNGQVQPWPYTVNMEGKSHWFETEDDAQSYAYHHFKEGARSFDVGCFQLNYKWHHQGFSSLDEMFDPLAGGRYAAGFLMELYAEKGDWTQAAGAYHSRTPEYAARYIEKFQSFRATASDAPPIELTLADEAALERATGTSLGANAPSLTQPRINTYPLLQQGSSGGALGSLVPSNNVNQTRALVDFNGAG